MRFICDAKEYDSIDMIDVPATGTNYLGIYVTSDYRCVFVGLMTYEGFKITQAAAREVEHLAKVVRHPALERVVEWMKAGAG